MEQEEEEMRAGEIKRIVDDLHGQGLSDSEILRKLMEYLGVPVKW